LLYLLRSLTLIFHLLRPPEWGQRIDVRKTKKRKEGKKPAHYSFKYFPNRTYLAGEERQKKEVAGKKKGKNTGIATPPSLPRSKRECGRKRKTVGLLLVLLHMASLPVKAYEGGREGGRGLREKG